MWSTVLLAEVVVRKGAVIERSSIAYLCAGAGEAADTGHRVCVARGCVAYSSRLAPMPSAPSRASLTRVSSLPCNWAEPRMGFGRDENGGFDARETRILEMERKELAGS